MSKKSAVKSSAAQRLKEKLPAILVLAVVVGGVLVMIFQAADPSGSTVVEVKVPALTAFAKQGEALFTQNCARCHGVNGAGSENGPPLVHKTYNPGHHADAAFWIAAKTGVRAHHWRFGNMPPQPQVSQEQVKAIVAYIRELQTANGIGYQPHNMN